MSHPYQSFLDEFQIAIKKLVPLTPQELRDEAQKLHDELLLNEQATEKQIHQALSLIGRKEYPYRRAYEELCAGDEEQRLQTVVLERLEPAVRTKVEVMTSNGVILEEYVKSNLFEEQLSGDERLQVEQAISLADEVLDNQCDDRAKQRKETYELLVAKYTAEVERLQGLIDQLRAMGQGTEQEAEINAVTDRLEEGWSVVERDPSEEEIKQEIEYWTTVLHEGDEEEEEM